MDKKHLNDKRINIKGRFQMVNIITDVNLILPDNLKLKGTEQHILLVMWTHANEENVLYISNSTISEKTNLTLRTVEKYVPLLEKKGWLRTIKVNESGSKVRKITIPEEILKLINGDLTTEKYSEGTEKYSEGTEKYSEGTEKNNGQTELLTEHSTELLTEFNGVANAPQKRKKKKEKNNIITLEQLDQLQKESEVYCGQNEWE